jgi:hypothetical protein
LSRIFYHRISFGSGSAFAERTKPVPVFAAAAAPMASASSAAASAALAPPRWWRRAPPPWLLCVVLGFGLLWPWQTVLNSLPAIQLLFPASNGLATYCALAFNSPQLPTHLLVLAHGRRSSPGARHPCTAP